MNRILLWMSGLCYFFNCSYAQSTGAFQEVSSELGVSVFYESAWFGQGISFYDFDNDGWDDLTLCTEQGGNTLYRNMNGSFEPWQNFQVPFAKSCLWGDLDNDGDNEIIFSTLNHGLYLFNANPDGYFIQVQNAFAWLDQVDNFNNVWLYGMSLADYNLDGYLDLIVANYNTEKANFAFINQHNLNFTIDPNTAVKSFQKATFQPAAIDINQDLRTDLYFANDYEQGNDFFFNQTDSLGFSSWSLASPETGLGIAINSMCNSWCDYDNDQDLDVYVSNLEPGNQLLQNDGNASFQNIAESLGVAVHQQSWSSLWIDANNDQWNDLLVTSASADYAYSDWNGHFFWGQGGGEFSDADTSSFSSSAYNTSKGDFNRDGLYDVAMTSANSDIFKLYQNTDTSQNHFIRFTPHGKLSNQNGVGCHYYVYTADNTQYGYIQSGENYLGQNSQHLIVGIGTNTSVDSLVVQWPSGIIDKYFNVPQSSDLEITEGKSRWYVPNIPEGICNIQDSIWYHLDSYYNYLWSSNYVGNDNWISIGNYTYIALYNNYPIDTISFHLAHWELNNEFTTISAPCNAGSYGAILGLDSAQQYAITPIHEFTQLPIGTYQLHIDNDQGCSTDTIFSIGYDHDWTLIIQDSIWYCENTLPQYNSIFQSNFPIIESSGWAPQLADQAQDIEVQITNEWGCSIDTSITIIPILFPTYHIDTTQIANGIQLSLSNDENGNVFFQSNHQNTLEITSNGFYVIELENNGCIQTDTIQVEIPIISSVTTADPESKKYWILSGHILTQYNPSNETPIAVFNSSGQSIPIIQLSENQWRISRISLPIFILSKSGFHQPLYQVNP